MIHPAALSVVEPPAALVQILAGSLSGGRTLPGKLASRGLVDALFQGLG
jgi:hypothetical protein